ncbi:polysaccharide pyruvyl transferase family protein [Marinilactibacillus sp. Marseille-P9653]|uniref:polysaccharide pyruvyl transferase family protein n=1 Tax=Marinilactibacillus sp. Marseille-P9653 TaxID=2866583 RepID=UPI001CE497A0|nr:polysaccharide pyruvyl transferase family protein [Marinilactibacillus sp. Marseille-P9653]
MELNLFVQGYWEKNLGDDLFLYILCNKYPSTHFSISGKKKNTKIFAAIDNLDIIEQKNNILTKIMNKGFSKLGLLNPYDKIGLNYSGYIEIGGSIFILPNKLNQVDLWLKRRKYIVENNKNYFVIGSNFGPFFFHEQIEEYRNFFSKLISVNFRDLKSYNMFSELSNVNVAPDVIFNLYNENTNFLKKEKTVVISVIDLEVKSKSPGSEDLIKFNKEYNNKLVELVNYYLTNDYDKVILMSFCDNEGDLNTCNFIYDNVNNIEFKEKIEIFSHNNINKSLEVLKNASLVIASRFHAMILGWIFESSTIVIGYSDKTKQTVDYLNINQQVLSISEFTDMSAKEIDKSQYLIEKATLQSLKEKSEVQFKDLDAFVNTY